MICTGESWRKRSSTYRSSMSSLFTGMARYLRNVVSISVQRRKGKLVQRSKDARFHASRTANLARNDYQLVFQELDQAMEALYDEIP